MRIALCDDDKPYLTVYENLFDKNYHFAECISYTHPYELLNDMKAGQVFDIVLMDIDFNEHESGIGWAEKIFEVSPITEIIFITAYTETYIQDIFCANVNLCSFLVKPVSENYFTAAVSKAISRLDAKTKSIPINIHGATILISPQEIICLESKEHNLLITTVNEVYTIKNKLSDFCTLLPENFWQCHKSYCVNLDCVKSIKKDEFILKNGRSVPISRANKAIARSLFMKYIESSLREARS